MSFWNERYQKSEYIFGTAPNAFLADFFENNSANANIPKNGKVLCIGDGEGRNSVFMAKLGFEVTAMDASEVGLNKAQKLAEQNQVKLSTQVADLEFYDMGEKQWDVIISIFCHLPPDLRKAVHAQVLKALKPQGLFVLEAYTQAQLQFATGGPSNPAMLYSVDMLQNDFQVNSHDGLQIICANEVTKHLQEGTAHMGQSAVVDWIIQVP